MVRTLAVEWAPNGIRINAVTPGSISTPNFPDSEQTREIMRNSLVPMGRSGTIDELCGAMLFLSSDMASYVTGHNLWVDGGWGAANLFRMPS
jgi:NAD(P)-dependent dehydrogenase (short-subunit alcohol dehydrogenase family)